MTRALAVVFTVTLVLAGVATWAFGAGGEAANAPAPAIKSPLSDPNFFPLSVWMQDQRNAAKYKAIGINLIVAAEPDDRTLATLKRLGMYAICVAGENAYKHKDDPTIIAWMHGDEPDNAQDIKIWKSEADIKKAWPESPDQPLAKWGEYGPPIPPSTIIAEYEQIKKADPTRPVLLNLGQGVAWEGYYGRGYRSGKLQDYPEYVKGSDIASFDIYPANHDKPAVEGKLEFVAQGVDRLVKWCGPQRTAWNCIECTPMGGPERKPTTSQVRSEVWMSLIHGSKGIIYFVHVFKPTFIEAGLLADPEMASAVGAINKQITELAPVLNSPTLKDAATVTSSSAEVPIDILVKKDGGAVYIFAVAMRNAPAKGAFQVNGITAGSAEVLGENRKIDVAGGKFSDDFAGYGVHLYKITAVQ